MWFKVLETLKLDAMFDKVAELPTKGRWDLMAQAAMRDDLESLAASITAAAIDKAGDELDPEKVVQGWLTSVHADEELTTLGMIADGPADLARVSVATRTLRAMLA